MNVLLFGASGMIGQGVLRECLRDSGITSVLSIGRSSAGHAHPKLRELILPSFDAIAAHEQDLTGIDACFFSAGVTSIGLSEAEYSRLTYDLTLSVAEPLARFSPSATFVYVSGAGADSTEQRRVMWARVKGRTENALLRLAMRVYILRPSLIVPLHGIRSRTWWYNVAYALTRPFNPLLRRTFPGFVTDTERVGRVMIALARRGYGKQVLESADINMVARQ